MSAHSHFQKFLSILKTYSRFIGPGLMVSVAYMDPGNYSTAVAAGSAYKYHLLFLILLSNCLAIFLQILAAKLGAVTGLDLAANCKANFSFRVNLFIYILAEIAIIATDLAEVVGTAISLNILFNLPLFLGVVVTVVDVLIVLMAYRPKGPLLFIRIFEGFVSLLVGATVVCFAIELYQVSNDPSLEFSGWEVLKGFLPSEKVIDMEERPGGSGLFLSLAILGATVMPHSLYLGSGLVQSRLKDFDIKHGYYHPEKKSRKLSISVEGNSNPLEPALTPDNPDDTLTPVATPYNELHHHRFEKKDNDSTEDEDENDENYRPSVHAINDTMTYTIVELVISLFTVALFVNAAILIVAGATLHGGTQMKRDDSDSDSDSDSDDYENADLFTIYHLLSKHLSPTAGFVFALALLCSGQSAGVVCTLAGQMVSEGFLSWSLPPVVRRLITRGLAITPCLLVVSFSGREGLAKVLNASQVVLSILLPVVSAPLIYFTCSKEIMRVPIFIRDGDELLDDSNILDDVNDYEEITLPGGGAPVSNTPHRFRSTEPAIRLQDLRKSHPCAGWDEEDDDVHLNHGSEEQHRLLVGDDLPSHSSPQKKKTHTPELEYSQHAPSNIQDTYTEDEVDYRIKGYKDYSNGPITSFLAVLVWGFITSLNLYLIISMMMGYEVPM
ncbi:natural resistance-associated macrophage protein [Suhomyces tanzawaensis NRRL Y-17324]|uniref:Natural resistance-associated macrophage protein n=1 Tax=Suhomyces tanzawaensis NRRL Y-17324 TaxID=984487 RepID=A0A1E4SFR5_9ASCO|nr:natural resistance-associated macrophage protein [Suhomyces tanzawaensis NRRL Y-17324]ODV78305.1 natural resistance-associated macrophage protein [Suhomyces tanzawaensis NRRL Y-17324]